MAVFNKLFGGKKERPGKQHLDPKRIPFRTFNGFIKKCDQKEWPTLEGELFELLFPLFEGTSEAETAYKNAIQDPLASVFDPLIELAPGARRPCRYSGYGFPRGRYYTLCRDISGNDSQTLVHELRAYRNPINYGMVEVVDLANGCQLGIRNTTVELAAEPAIAVLIHEPEALPAKFHALKFQNVAGLKDQPLSIFRFPYKVSPCKIEQTIDLRFPDVRDWFYQTFHDLPDAIHSGTFPESGLDTTPTIAHSRFHFENGQPSTPDSFWAMLPTLINPDIGGGNPADTGSTLLSIGHWMRQNDVSALIYPSARCDTTVIFENGELKKWQGWSLIDYRKSPVFGSSNIEVFTFVLSPWAWDRLPAGVKLHVAGKGSPYEGSFSVENMVNYWSDDYLRQLEALEIARAIHGREKPRDQRRTSSEGLGYRVFQIGSLSIRWARMMLQGLPSEQIENVVLELQGLALPEDLYTITGRVLELWSDAQERALPIQALLNASIAANNLLFRCLYQRYTNEELDKLAEIGADIELILFFLAMREKAGTKVKDAPVDMSGFLEGMGWSLTTHWLDDDMKDQIREFHKKALSEVKTGGGRAEHLLEDGTRLQQAVYNHLRAKRNNH